MNALVGERLSIITSKAQTTRHRIMGIVNGDDFQIVYSDTPGILRPSYKLQESMMKFVRGALTDADILLYVTDTVEKSDESSDEIVGRIARSAVPTIVVINKIDLTTPERLEELVEKWKQRLPQAVIAPVSAKGGIQHRRTVRPYLRASARGRAVLPEGYAHRQDPALLRLGDHPRKDTALLRQGDTLLLPDRHRLVQGGTLYRPHLGDDIRRARLAKGHRHRPQGREAQTRRSDRTRGPGTVPAKRVFLQLYVKVDPDWRNDDRQLRRFGYEQE